MRSIDDPPWRDEAPHPDDAPEGESADTVRCAVCGDEMPAAEAPVCPDRECRERFNDTDRPEHMPAGLPDEVAADRDRERQHEADMEAKMEAAAERGI